MDELRTFFSHKKSDKNNITAILAWDYLLVLWECFCKELVDNAMFDEWPIFYDFISRCSTSQNRNIKDNHLWIEDISWSEFGLFCNQRALSVWRTWWTEYLRDWTFCERWCWQDSDFVTRTRRWYTIYILGFWLAAPLLIIIYVSQKSPLKCS